MSLEQISQLSVILPLQVIDRLVDIGEISGKQLTYSSCCFDFAEEHLGEEQSFEGVSSSCRYVQSSHQIVVEDSLFTEFNELLYVISPVVSHPIRKGFLS